MFYVLATVLFVSVALVYRLSDASKAPFLHSEWLCWVILFLFAKVTEKSGRFAQIDGHGQAERLSLAITACALCWTLGEARWALVN